MSDNPLGSVGDRPARRTQLPEEVASYVRELIVSGSVRAGDFLRLEPIAEAVGVSNTPVREGLHSLRSEGFVRLEPRRGFVVASFTRQDIKDLFWVQARYAGELTARASKLRTDQQLERLRQNIADYDVAVKNDSDEAITRLGHEFHREINLAADSRRLALLLGTVVSHMPNKFYSTIEGQIEESTAAHPEIIDAIAARDSRRARSLMEQHIIKGSEHLVETLEARGLWR